MITVVLRWIFLSESRIGCYLSDHYFSPILQTIKVREIGQQFSLRDLEPFLCNGVISAHFHSLGNKPEKNDLFNICASEGASSDAHSLKTQGVIFSGPGDLLGLSFKRRRLTSLTLQLIYSSLLTTT